MGRYKILEKIVAEKLIHHLTSNELLYVHQYGFLPKKSTEHNLMQILNYITTALNDGMFCIGVFWILGRHLMYVRIQFCLKN
jgi:hypothetical protein